MALGLVGVPHTQIVHFHFKVCRPQPFWAANLPFIMGQKTSHSLSVKAKKLSKAIKTGENRGKMTSYV
jgi:hypothetical protein